jgi:bis(5'-nucleosyl)-tetraphosphatase (symmetrical)
MHYLVGDPQGCCDAFDRLLAEIGFSPSRDRLHVLGDLVNRGPQSLRILQRLSELGDAAVALLGNHDLHLLAVAAGVRPEHRSDTLHQILDAPDRERWIEWVRHRPLADEACGWLLVHAGVVPQWDTAQTLALAREVETLLRGPDLRAFLQVMYGNDPYLWDDRLEGPDRWRFVINVLTRIRFCSDEGMLEFSTKDGVGAAPQGFRPWFDVPGRRTEGTPIGFGHWSALGLLQRPDLLGLDTGCVWGGALTAVRVDEGRREVVQVKCAKGAASV